MDKCPVCNSTTDKWRCGEEGCPLPSAAAEVDRLMQGGLPWRPITELGTGRERYSDEVGFLILAPELVDLDCNVHGVGMGFWQDDGLKWNASQEECDNWSEDKDAGCWLACKWSMTNDEWMHVPCNPTHYLRLTGAQK